MKVPGRSAFTVAYAHTLITGATDPRCLAQRTRRYHDDSTHVLYECLCGRWTCSEEFALRAGESDVCEVTDGCGTPPVRKRTRTAA